MDDEFSFEDVDSRGSPMATTPLPEPAPLSGSYDSRPGTLFGRSPVPVASGVTRGEKKEETRVRLLHVGDPANVCGGVIGAVENKKFCVVHPRLCEFQASHGRKKFELEANTLYVMSAKKGGLHATLLPTLRENCIPADKGLGDLLADERPIAMWHVYFDGCNTSEASTGHNELKGVRGDTWDSQDRPSLEDLEIANDFKTPKKVRLLPEFSEPEEELEDVQLDAIPQLDLTGLTPVKGEPSASQKAVRQIFESWSDVRTNFQILSHSLGTMSDRTKGDRVGVRMQLQEFELYLNDLGTKSRLLSAKIGENPSSVEHGESSVWEAIGELNSEFKLLKTTLEAIAKKMDSELKTLKLCNNSQTDEWQRVHTNMTKMYKHYKGHLGTSN